jgi:multidrug efflux pump subunit AcrA (membrane-fusion protein)
LSEALRKLLGVDALEIIRQLEGDPALRAQLRALLLSEELLAMPQRLEALQERLLNRLSDDIGGLVSAQQRTEARLEELAAAQQRTEARLEELAAAQQRTEARLEELAAAQQRTEARLEDLAAAQQRTEARLEELAAAQQRTETAVQELAAAQERTDANLARLEMALATLTERVGRLELGQERLEESQDRVLRELDLLRSDFGRFSALIGGTIEEDAVSLIETVLSSQGWVFRRPPAAAQLDGELDVLATAEDVDGKPFTVIAEAKVRLRPADVRRFAGALPQLLREAGASGEYLGYVYGLRLYPGATEAASEAGLGVLHWSGEKLAPQRRLTPV